MAGLGVLLEAQKNFPNCPQVISKITLSRKASNSSPALTPTPFLEYCYLCRSRLAEGKDIYMYRGDRAFCSVECRCKQIFMDEESGRRDNCSLAAASAEVAGRASASRHRRGVAAGKGRAAAGGAGGFAY